MSGFLKEILAYDPATTVPATKGLFRTVKVCEAPINASFVVASNTSAILFFLASTSSKRNFVA